MYGSIEVNLHKQKHSTLGLTISGGADRGYPPRITGIKPGSIADKSDCLMVNDIIKSINGSSTTNLTYEQIVKLTKCSDTSIRLGLEYVLTDSEGLEGSPPVTVGSLQRPLCCLFVLEIKELVVGQIDGHQARIHSPRTCERILWHNCSWRALQSGKWSVPFDDLSNKTQKLCRKGDRILAIDGVQTRGLTCEESMKLLVCHRSGISLFIEYDVADIGAEGRQGSGPFEIEIDKLPTERLGAHLAAFGENLQGKTRLLISHILDGSIADRCGALQVGDLIETINGRNAAVLSLQEANELLCDTSARSVKLRILPCPEIFYQSLLCYAYFDS
ncbi:unnamed protein product [Rodentolepis nana]|uniref:PDZ domain-containing protein n=1 Tax=Rodentolepis nana TaxID=102285 RepID=A0A0R3T9I5_RODNA|nr:unnamed protein product [Rodentolepis nana]